MSNVNGVVATYDTSVKNNSEIVKCVDWLPGYNFGTFLFHFQSGSQSLFAVGLQSAKMRIYDMNSFKKQKTSSSSTREN